MALEEPALPAVPEYPSRSPWNSEIEGTRDRFLRELGDYNGWKPMGEKQGVKLWRKYDDDNNPIPCVRGETIVKNASPYAFLAGVVQMPGMRKLWDPRTEQGCMLQRFSRNEVLFYAVTKGKRFIASPRDIVGVQKDYVEQDGSCMIVQKSVQTDAAPEQSGMRRANLDLSGWHFQPHGEDLKVTYIFRIGLGGMIPNALVSMATTETPLCTGRARDTYYEYGYAPYIRHTPDEPSTIFQKESFQSPPAREYACTVTTGQKVGETFEIAYDLRRMYKPEGGVQVAVKGEGIQAVDDGKGTVKVQTTASGKTATVVLTPR